MNNLFKKLFNKQQEPANNKVLLELKAMQQRNKTRMDAIKDAMGTTWVLHPEHKKSRLETPRPV